MEKMLLFATLFLHSFIKANGQCTGYADIVLAVPGSSSVPYTEFDAFEAGLIQLFDHFEIEPDQINIGLILYGENAINIASPQPFKTRTQINTRATLLGQRESHLLGFENNVSKAIMAVNKMLQVPPIGYPMQILRPGARKIGVIFTYGPADVTDISSIRNAAAVAKGSGVLMYAISSNGTGLEFEKIGTDRCRLMSMGSYKEGLKIAMPDLAKGICSELDPTVTVSRLNCFPNQYGRVQKLPVTCSTENNMVQPDPNNCAYFYRCAYYDTIPLLFPCPQGTIYDPLTTNCNMLDNVACYNDLKCENAAPYLYPHPLDCSKYINCDMDLIPHVQSCAPGLLFDEPWQSCNESSLVVCNK